MPPVTIKWQCRSPQYVTPRALRISSLHTSMHVTIVSSCTPINHRSLLVLLNLWSIASRWFDSMIPFMRRIIYISLFRPPLWQCNVDRNQFYYVRRGQPMKTVSINSAYVLLISYDIHLEVCLSVYMVCVPFPSFRSAAPNKLNWRTDGRTDGRTCVRV